jgi:phosphoribosylformimino-5-aminoimidazole carboxamide ribonucleotide (ProFAR) isomerase
MSTVQKFIDVGLNKFHIIDLDGARLGKPQIENTIKTIKKYLSVFFNVIFIIY